MGGLDKLNVRQSAVVQRRGAHGPADREPRPAQRRRRGGRGPRDLGPSTASSMRKDARARVRSPYADQERDMRGIGGDFLALDGYEIEEGRDLHASTTSTRPRRSPSSARRRSRRSFPTATPSAGRCGSATCRSRSSAILRERIFRFRDVQPEHVPRGATASSRCPSTLVAAPLRGRPVPPPRPRHLPHPRSRRDGEVLQESLLACSRRTTASRRTSASTTSARACARSSQPGRRLRHHLHALGLPVADRRRHRQRQHPDGDAEGAHPRGRRQDGDRRARAARSSRSS